MTVEEPPRRTLRWLTLLLLVFSTVGVALYWGVDGRGLVESRKLRIDMWLEEVLPTEAVVKCTHSSEHAKRDCLDDILREIPVHHERAQVDTSEYLKSLQRMNEALMCASEISLTDDPKYIELELARDSLKGHLERLIRAHHARLHRAQLNSDLGGVLLEVRVLRRVLQAHRGKLLPKLTRWERRLEKELLGSRKEND